MEFLAGITECPQKIIEDLIQNDFEKINENHLEKIIDNSILIKFHVEYFENFTNEIENNLCFSSNILKLENPIILSEKVWKILSPYKNKINSYIRDYKSINGDNINEDIIKNQLINEMREYVVILNRNYEYIENQLNQLLFEIQYNSYESFGLKIFNILFFSANLFEQMSKLLLGIPEKIKEGNKLRYPIINDYMVEEIKNLLNNKIFFILDPNHEMKSFNSFIDQQSPEWWKIYNTVKHNIKEIHNCKLEQVYQSLSSCKLLIDEINRKWNDYQITPYNDKESIFFTICR